MNRREFLKILGLAPAAVAALGVPLPAEDDGMVTVNELWTSADSVGYIELREEIFAMHPTADGLFIKTAKGLWIIHEREKSPYKFDGPPFVSLKLHDSKEG